MTSPITSQFLTLSPEVQDEILAKTLLLQISGPNLRRHHVDTLNGSRYSNMKEIRFNADDGVWRVAFAFIPNGKQFYWWLGINPAGVRSNFTNN